MENNTPYYVTYKFHDDKGRRLAIFAVPVARLKEGVSTGEVGPTADLKLHLYIFTCSKKDSFSKQTARDMYLEYITLKQEGLTGSYGHPMEIVIPVNDDKPKFTFLKWCEETYFKYIPTVFALEAPMLYRGNELLNGKFPTFDILPIGDIEDVPFEQTEN